MVSRTLDELRKACPGSDRLLIMQNGKIYPTADGNLRTQLKDAGIREVDVRAVVVRESAGLTVPHIAQHDISRPLYVMSAGSILALGLKQLAKLRAAIKYAHG